MKSICGDLILEATDNCNINLKKIFNLVLEERISLGRNSTTSFVLDDGKNIVSNFHCEIQKKHNGYFLKDHSSNGTIVNDIAINSSETIKLKNENILSIGDFKIKVKIVENILPVDPLTELLKNFPNPEEDLEVNKMVNLVDKNEGSSEEPKIDSCINDSVKINMNLFQKFMKELGLPDKQVSENQQEVILLLSAKLLKLSIEGVLESLKVRNEIKKVTDSNQTMVFPKENNILKYSINSEDAIERLFKEQNSGFLGPAESIEQAFSDISSELVSLLKSSHNKINQIFSDLEPSEIKKEARKIAPTWIPYFNSKMYWDSYSNKIKKMKNEYQWKMLGSSSSLELPNSYKRKNENGFL